MPSVCYERIFIPGCYYHIYNRGAHQQRLFRDAADYHAFTEILGYYLTHPNGLPQSTLARKSKEYKVTILVKESPGCSLLAYCLMPNHFHLMLRQEDSNFTISNLLRRLSVGYAMYYNDRYHHSGTIFQGRYKNVIVTNEYQWIYMSKYIHRNPAHLQSYDPCKLSEYPYSSYPSYLGKKQTSWLDISTILGRNLHNPCQEYQKFVEDGGDPGNIDRIAIDAEEDQSLQGS